MIESIRQDLASLNQNNNDRSNLSLLFNRLCLHIDEPAEKESGAKEQTLESLIHGYKAPGYLKLYKYALKKWRQKMEKSDDVICFEMKTISPMVIGKRDQNVHEFGMTLQLPWGTPVIPGSAVKGVASAFAHQTGGEHWYKKQSNKRQSPEDAIAAASAGKHSLVMFGGITADNDEYAGCLDFFDAWWVPSGNHTSAASPFCKDIINSHYSVYYQDGKTAPHGMENPIPNPFAVIKPGEKFLFAIKGPQTWGKLAKNILVKAAADFGFGAKTGLGYGRLKYIKTPAEIAREIPHLSDQELAELFSKNNQDEHLNDAFKTEAYKRSYDTILKAMFKRYRPVCCFHHDLFKRKPEKWSEIRNIHEQHKKALNNADDIDPNEPLSQEIFDYCYPRVPRGTVPLWLERFAISAVDFIAGKTGDQILTMLEKEYPARTWPPINDLKSAIQASPSLSADDKELLTLHLEDINDPALKKISE